MTIELRNETIPANGQTLFAGGNIFRLLAASAAVEVRAEIGGSSERILNVTALIYRRTRPFDYIRVIGAPGTTLQAFYGTENVEEDSTDVPVAAIQITGTANVNIAPSAGLVNNAPVDANTAAETLLIAANLSRKCVRVQADVNNSDGGTTATRGGLIRNQSGGNNLADLQPGTWREFYTTGALYVRNDGGATNRFYIEERN